MMTRIIFALVLSFAGTCVAVQVREKADSRTKQIEDVHSHSKRPNILWILADDLHDEAGSLQYMPNLNKMKRNGLHFPNHVSPAPLCGPSRASLLVGRLPHNAGYKSNAELKSVEAFRKLQDSSVGKWLTDAGYYTVFLGKYVNAIMQHEENMPKGWRHFGAFTESWDFLKKTHLGGGYTYYNTSQWDLSYDEKGKLIKKNNSDYPINIWTGVHQADFLATQTLDHAKESVDMGKPFFIFANPTMIHHGYCTNPTDSKGKRVEADHDIDDPWFEEHLGLGAMSPCAKKDHNRGYMVKTFGDFTLHSHTSAWNKSAIGQVLQPGTNCCDSEKEERQTYGRRNRTASLADLDEMVGTILRGLKKLKVMDNTYVFFTSDNGFHMGEHKFEFGKELPYDHDVRVPMLALTPDGTKGLRNLPTSHVDITATIVDLAGAGKYVAPSSASLDGKSFAGALTKDVRAKDWRQYSFSEMFESNKKTWRNIRYVGDTGKAEWSMIFWCTGHIEVFDLKKDEDQLINVLHEDAGEKANTWGEQIVQSWMPVINGMGTCTGATCNSERLVSKSIGSEELSYDVVSNLMVCEDNSRMMELAYDTSSDYLAHEEGWD